MNHKALRIFLFTIGSLAAGTMLRAETVLLGNKGLAGQTLDAESVKAVLLGKKVTLGSSRVVVVIVKNSPAQDAFLQSTVGMTTSQFQNHWRRLFMTGGGTAPKLVENDAEAAKLAGETAGAIAIADRGAAGELPVLFSAKN
ncbi:MAG TPA: hypothetical protein VFT72_16450 [Opitutaceae bacterium]|nr:hypothetical protein [Opitutaceae bacterium]